VDTTEWHVVPREVLEQWDVVFNAAYREHHGIRLDAACPNCGTVALRQFYIRHLRVDPASFTNEPAWMRERAARNVDGADGLEWCAHCHIYDHIKDKSAPPWWPDTVAGVERGDGYTAEGVMGAVMAYLAEHGDV
jgi:hypothetical protein